MEGPWIFTDPDSDQLISTIDSEMQSPPPAPDPEHKYKINFSSPRNPHEDQVYNTASMDETKGEHEPVHFPGQDLAQLNFACLLIPRIKTHLLTGDLARFLDEVIPTIFLAFGWRLETLMIEKQYMQWIVRIPSAFATSNHIKIVRKESSKMILGNFTRLNKDGLITDFWAPGHLLEGGKQSISDREIEDFIRANRQQYYPDERNNRIPKANYFTIN